MNAKDIIDALKIIKDECRCHRYCIECEYSFKDMQSKLIRLLDGRHLDWQMKQLKTPILQETGNVVSVL